jgi:AcrR family transcriptional regulator
MPKILADEQIFSAVMQVVSSRGYSGSTTKQLADAANISEVTLFRKYGSKAQLVKQAISFILEQTDFAAAARYTGNIEMDLLSIVQAYQESAVKHGLFFATLFSEVSRHPELVDSIEGPLTIFHSIVELIARYQAEGKLQREQPSLTVAALLGPLIYTSMMSNAMPNVSIPPVELRTHVKLFLMGRDPQYSHN